MSHACYARSVQRPVFAAQKKWTIASGVQAMTSNSRSESAACRSACTRCWLGSAENHPRARTFIEENVRAELDAALTRGSYSWGGREVNRFFREGSWLYENVTQPGS
jgi:hypothetical protein